MHRLRPLAKPAIVRQSRSFAIAPPLRNRADRKAIGFYLPLWCGISPTESSKSGIVKFYGMLWLGRLWSWRLFGDSPHGFQNDSIRTSQTLKEQHPTRSKLLTSSIQRVTTVAQTEPHPFSPLPVSPEPDISHKIILLFVLRFISSVKVPQRYHYTTPANLSPAIFLHRWDSHRDRWGTHAEDAEKTLASKSLLFVCVQPTLRSFWPTTWLIGWRFTWLTVCLGEKHTTSQLANNQEEVWWM